jgi:hypothetical protein
MCPHKFVNFGKYVFPKAVLVRQLPLKWSLSLGKRITKETNNTQNY